MDTTQTIKPMFTFEMANNHSGSVEHGIAIMKAIREKCIYPEFDYAFKFQYRDLDTFIHPAYKDRMDIKNVKRFTETRLSEQEFIQLKQAASELGFKTVCTPFDEVSVDRVVAHGYDYLKIASCSFTDWALLEKIATQPLPIIASTAGASLDDIDNVVGFFKHRGCELSIMHCVAEYPTKPENLQIGQIALLLHRYPGVRVGYSTHEPPDATVPVAMAVAKGATIFEKHVGLPTENIKLNGYSADPDQVAAWLAAAHEAFIMNGLEGERQPVTEKEEADLQALRRGVWAKGDIKAGDWITADDTFLAFPSQDGQLVINAMGKYKEVKATKDIAADEPVLLSDVEVTDVRDQIARIYNDVHALLDKSGVAIADDATLEISHHYGVGRFYEYGTTIIECINREYCKKILIMLPGQDHPTHTHKVKEETFQVLYGDIEFTLGGETHECHVGDIMTVERGVPHSFKSRDGGIFEEVSSTHYKSDSYYDDPAIMANTRRKTHLRYWGKQAI